MNPQTIELTDSNRTKINYMSTEDDIGFSFRADTDMSFSEIQAPTAEQQIPLKANIRFKFKRSTIFYVKWVAGNKVFLSPFER